LWQRQTRTTVAKKTKALKLKGGKGIKIHPIIARFAGDQFDFQRRF